MSKLSRLVLALAIAAAPACTIEIIDQDDPPFSPDAGAFDSGCAGFFCPDGGDQDGGSPLDAVISCGDGLLHPGEVCDDGNNVDGDGCSADCASNETCGNAVVDVAAGEQCDDGNTNDSDACSNTCRVNAASTCGDGVVNGLLEQCDNGQPGANTASCDRDCTLPLCGDNLANFAAGEQCDTGGFSGTCDSDCTATVCGDGLVNPSAGEQCDDGNTNDADACRNDCRLP